ncbi:MAG: hypothetical protein HRU03_02915 [Nanoarchaeales archaeon]|nr:hypothetical protein [Nanoarchaeales archaeon]
MVKKIIKFDGPFPLAKAIIHNDKYTMEISGQIGVNQNTNELEIGIEKQTQRVMEIIKEILENENWSMSDIVKTRIYLKDMKDYSNMNEVYSKYFSENYPTRFALAVKELPRDALVEIDCTATRNEIN